jgi:hypothetical protein
LTPPTDKAAHLGVEEDHDGEQRADMHGDVDGEALVLPRRQLRDEDEVGRRTDRQEFGDALHHGEDDQIEPVHRQPFVRGSPADIVDEGRVEPQPSLASRGGVCHTRC